MYLSNVGLTRGEISDIKFFAILNWSEFLYGSKYLLSEIFRSIEKLQNSVFVCVQEPQEAQIITISALLTICCWQELKQ